MKNIRKLFASAMSAVLLTLALAHATAAAPRVVNVILDGSPVDFIDTNAQIIHDYTYVPIARIIEILTGSPPDWDAANKMASFDFNNNHYKIYANQSGIYINDVFHEFETKPEIVDSRTLIPLRMLSDALGFAISWDGATSTVTLTSPPQSPAEVYSIDPQNVNVVPGSSVTVNLLVSDNTVEVKVRNTAGATIAESKQYVTVDGNRRFSITFTPQTAGIYCTYAATRDGYNVHSHKDISVTFGAGTAINSVELSRDLVSFDDTVTLTVYTTADATRVKLQSDYYSSDVREQTNYTASGNQRIFRIDWPIRSSYYSGRTSVSAKIYAGNSVGYTDSYKSVTVRVGSQPVEIYETKATPQGIYVNQSSTISVITNTNIKSLSFAVLTGSGSFASNRITNYTESGGRRYWENTYYAGSSAGTMRLSVTGTPYSGLETISTVSVVVLDDTPPDGQIYDIVISPDEDITVGTRVFIDVTTGIDVTRVAVSNSISSSLGADMNSSTTSGGRKIWRYQFTVPESADGYYNIGISTYIGNQHADQDITSIYVNPRFYIDDSN